MELLIKNVKPQSWYFENGPICLSTPSKQLSSYDATMYFLCIGNAMKFVPIFITFPDSENKKTKKLNVSFNPNLNEIRGLIELARKRVFGSSCLMLQTKISIPQVQMDHINFIFKNLTKSFSKTMCLCTCVSQRVWVCECEWVCVWVSV